MKMAKPSAQDKAAAEELHQVLQLIDARFGGPFPNDEAGDDLGALLGNGDNAFDCDDIEHLQTLYNHLARLLRNAPSFYGRVIGGMVWVIMNEANQILDPESDCIDLHPRFQQLADELTKLQAEIERLRGLQPEFPPRPPDGSGLPRYGLRWNGPSTPLAVPMDDGYWTPWHLAAAAITEHASTAVPEGWKLAPSKPSIEMVEAGYEASLGQPDRSGHARTIEMYEAMLNAAPIAQPAAEQSAPGEVDGPDITTKHGYPAYSVAQHKRIVAQLTAQLDQMTTQCKWSQERASAWDAVAEKLQSINPAMMQGMGRTGLECAIAQIDQLAAPVAQPEQSGLVEALQVALDDVEVPPSLTPAKAELFKAGARAAAQALRAALSAQGGEL